MIIFKTTASKYIFYFLSVYVNICITFISSLTGKKELKILQSFAMLSPSYELFVKILSVTIVPAITFNHAYKRVANILFLFVLHQRFTFL